MRFQPTLFSENAVCVKRQVCDTMIVLACNCLNRHNRILIMSTNVAAAFINKQTNKHVKWSTSAKSPSSLRAAGQARLW